MTHSLKLLLASVSFILISCAAQNEAVANQSNCRVLIEHKDGEIEHVKAPTIDLSKGEKFILPDNLVEASSIVCERPNLVAKTSDFLVVSSAERPVYLTGEEAKIVIEMVNGQFRLRVIDGELNEEQISLLQTAMNEAQLIVQGE